MTEITRVTMIKLKSSESIPTALEGFKTFTQQQKRNGKPYILLMQAGPAQGAALSQGYNFVTKSVFKNADDMKFYEEECEGHQAYKVFLKENAPVEGIMPCAFEVGVSWTL